MHRRVAIKEFFVKEYCNRDSTTSQVTLGISEGSKELVNRFRTKFIREAQMIAALDNPHVVKIYDIFEENGTAYYVMPFFEGGSLADKVKKSGPMPEQDAIGYIMQIGNALDYLHKQNILHLDVKPSNVLLNASGQVVLIDFGISKHYDNEGSQTSTTPVGISRGYAPIEQYQQGDIAKFTPATDIYSLGATFYFLLTGQTPPDASEINEEGLPKIMASITDKSLSAIEKALSPRRKDRPQEVNEFLSRLNTNELISPETKGIPLGKANTHSMDESTILNLPVEKPSEIVPTNKARRRELRPGVLFTFIISLVASLTIGGVIIFSNELFSTNTNTEKPIEENPLQSSTNKLSQSDKDIAQETTSTGISNGHEWVDLGLSVKWATCNVGASSPHQFGLYFAWGETSPKDDEYKWSTYKWCKGSSSTLTKYNFQREYGKVDRMNRLDFSDDAARENWGGNWRMPTDEEWTELLNGCIWKKSGTGYQITSKVNKNSIFLPAAGYISNVGLVDDASGGYYWSSSLDEYQSSEAWTVRCLSDDFYRSNLFRCHGRSVRAVIE